VCNLYGVCLQLVPAAPHSLLTCLLFPRFRLAVFRAPAAPRPVR
jgi:hypothetical protein